MIYLDYNATAPIRPEVVVVMMEAMALPANPSSVHRLGRAAKATIEQSRRTLADALSCWPGEVIFTASGTEANNMVLKSFGALPCAVAATEHASVLKTRPDAVRLPVDRQGILEMAALQAFLIAHPQPALISVMLANNETGVIQSIREIAALIHTHGGLLHVDAVQAFGKIPVDMNLLGADMLSLSAHKLGGGQGAGALIVSQKLVLPPMITGGGQESNRRAGTENVAAIAGFAKAVELALGDSAWKGALRGWLDDLEARCSAIFPDETLVIGQGVPRLPNTTLLRMPGVKAETQLMQWDLAGIALSAGSACSSGRIETSHVVKAMWGADAPDDAVRISGGWSTTAADIEAFFKGWQTFVTKNQAKRA
jgi:cysteine desulfurase